MFFKGLFEMSKNSKFKIKISFGNSEKLLFLIFN